MQETGMRAIICRRAEGEKIGIPSWCTANEIVIRTALYRAAESGKPVLIEATANQVNQNGGYTGLKPGDFYVKISEMARSCGVSDRQLILGGDHLGPLTWQDLPEKEAMDNARELVYAYTRAGFTKIHLDTSMKVADDPAGRLSTKTIARRGAELYSVCMEAYRDLLSEEPTAVRPVFIIGSEVPIPGGAQEEEEGLKVTTPEALEETLDTYRKSFADAGFTEEEFSDVVAVVVQPGVEFGDDQIFRYDRMAARELTECAGKHVGIGLEAHSTDYQSVKSLSEMVEDGALILKVGPELTYALREALFALSLMEKELFPAQARAYFIETLDDVMVQKPANWQKYYHGSPRQQAICRKYSYSDRCRYYLGEPEVVNAIDRLFHNLRQINIPMSLLHQFMPCQYDRINEGLIGLDPEELVMDQIGLVMEKYEKAARV